MLAIDVEKPKVVSSILLFYIGLLLFCFCYIHITTKFLVISCFSHFEIGVLLILSGRHGAGGFIMNKDLLAGMLA
mgnify:CR=1 FL=1